MVEHKDYKIKWKGITIIGQSYQKKTISPTNFQSTWQLLSILKWLTEFNFESYKKKVMIHLFEENLWILSSIVRKQIIKRVNFLFFLKEISNIAVETHVRGCLHVTILSSLLIEERFEKSAFKVRQDWIWSASMFFFLNSFDLLTCSLGFPGSFDHPPHCIVPLLLLSFRTFSFC